MFRTTVRFLALFIGFSAIMVGWTSDASAFHLAKQRRKVVVVERPVYLPPRYDRYDPPRHPYWHHDHWRNWKHHRHHHRPPPPWAPAWGRRR